MAYRVPTFDEMQQFLTSLFASLLPDRNVRSSFAFYYKLVKVITAAATDVHAALYFAGKNFMPDTTSREFLDRWLGIVGSKRKGATAARKSNAGRVIGTVGASYTSGAVLSHRATGLRFQLNASGTIPAIGYADVDILALSKGSATRLAAKEVLEFVSTPAGLSGRVELQRALDEDGLDVELDGNAQRRLLALLGLPQSGGNQADYVRWMTEQAGITSAFCYPNRAGTGTIDVAALHTGTGTSRFLNTGERTQLAAALQVLAPAPVGAQGGPLRVLTTVPEYASVELLITPNGDPAYAFDWDDTAVPTVASWDPATLTLTFVARPASLKAGDRVCLAFQFQSLNPTNIAGAIDGAPIIVESLSGANACVLASAPMNPAGILQAPLAGDLVYAGGPMTATIRDAIIAHINSDLLYAGADGPIPGAIAASTGTGTSQLKVLIEGVGTSNPAGRYGTWSGTLRRDAIFTIARYTPGVRVSSIVTPAVDQDSTDYTFPLDAQIGVLNAGYILVRRG